MVPTEEPTAEPIEAQTPQSAIEPIQYPITILPTVKINKRFVLFKCEFCKKHFIKNHI